MPIKIIGRRAPFQSYQSGGIHDFAAETTEETWEKDLDEILKTNKLWLVEVLKLNEATGKCYSIYKEYPRN